MLAYVGVGTNLGDRWAHLALAARELRSCPGVSFLRGSRVYDAAPMGPSQPRYLNAVVELEATRPAGELLAALLAVEQAAFRERGLRWGPRTLDLDLLLYGDAVVRTPSLTVPHPGLMSRRWVLAPLAELCPDTIVPGTGVTVAELLRVVPPYDMRPVGLYPG